MMGTIVVVINDPIEIIGQCRRIWDVITVEEPGFELLISFGHGVGKLDINLGGQQLNGSPVPCSPIHRP